MAVGPANAAAGVDAAIIAFRQADESKNAPNPGLSGMAGGTLPAAKPGEGGTRTPIAQGGSFVKPHQLEEEYKLPDTVIKAPPSETIKIMRLHPNLATQAREWAAKHLLGGKPEVAEAVGNSREALDLQHPDFEAMVSRIADKKNPGTAKQVVDRIAESAMRKLTPRQIGELGGPEQAKKLVLAEAYKLVDVTAHKTVANVKLWMREHS